MQTSFSHDRCIAKVVDLFFYYFLNAYTVSGCHADNIYAASKIADVDFATIVATQYRTAAGVEHLHGVNAFAFNGKNTISRGGVNGD